MGKQISRDKLREQWGKVLKTAFDDVKLMGYITEDTRSKAWLIARDKKKVGDKPAKK